MPRLVAPSRVDLAAAADALQPVILGALGEPVGMPDGPAKPGVEFVDRRAPDVGSNSPLLEYLGHGVRWWSRLGSFGFGLRCQPILGRPADKFQILRLGNSEIHIVGRSIPPTGTQAFVNLPRWHGSSARRTAPSAAGGRWWHGSRWRRWRAVRICRNRRYVVVRRVAAGCGQLFDRFRGE